MLGAMVRVGRWAMALALGVAWSGCAMVQLGLDTQRHPERAAALLHVSERTVVAGTVATLDDERLSSRAGRYGYWTPMQALQAGCGHVFMLEPYDPRRIPVLYVHGAGGSAQDWRPLLDALDRTRYQAWLFQYPSGLSIDRAASLLQRQLSSLRAHHRFGALVLTAHSMGGLVVRRFLLDHGDAWPEARLFVSLSTPWGGEALAELGVRAPAVVPSWHDMLPQGPFMQTLFVRRLPAHVQHVLFFGHRGPSQPWRAHGDGAVTLASQLRHEAQAEAQRVIGFDDDHMSILSSRAVLHAHRMLLAAFHLQASAPAADTSGWRSAATIAR